MEGAKPPRFIHIEQHSFDQIKNPLNNLDI
jgi:hypothetical protein